MSKNKIKDFFTKESKYENYILAVLGIASIVIGILGLLGILKMDVDKPTVLCIVLIALGIIVEVVFIFDLYKKSKYKKIIKPVIYELIQKEYETKEKKLDNILKLNGYLINEDDEYISTMPINKYINAYIIYISNDQFEVYIKVGIEDIEIEIDICEKLQETVKDEYFDLEVKHMKTDANLINSYDELLEIVDTFINENKQLILERYEAYKEAI